MSDVYADLRARLSPFSVDSFRDSAGVTRYCREFGIEALFREVEHDSVAATGPDLLRAVSQQQKPLEPEYADLCRLHWLALTRKTVTVLEFGSGFSTVVFADAMRMLSGIFSAWASANLRCKRPFHVHSVEEDAAFAEISRQRLGSTLASYATVTHSRVELMTFDHRIATSYSNVPNVSPDLIYLDGPSQFAATESVRGFSLADQERMPMSADVLPFEFFLQPGTLIVVDGRTANARFLRAYLKREWRYLHDAAGDMHYFELQEAPLGPLNRRQLEFCLEGRWLLESRRHDHT